MTPNMFKRLIARLTIASAVLFPTLAGAAENITIGEGIAINWVPFLVADEKKFWEEAGLNPTTIQFASGRLVLDAVAGGHVTVGTAAETPVAFAALNNVPIRIIGTVNHYESFDLAAIKDIKTIQDIKGHKIGYSQGTNSHYYLSKLLDKAGLKLSDITAISLSPSDFVTSLVNGGIDAFIWSEPHLSQALAQGPDRFHVIHTPGLYTTYSNIITLQSTIDEKPDLLIKALKALITSDQFAKKNPDEAALLSANRVKLDPQIAKKIWPNLHLSVDLDRDGLVRELETQAKWAIANNLVRPDAKLPDFNSVVISQPLESARSQLKN